MDWPPRTPKRPMIVRGQGKDGKKRLYLYASNEMDIEVMLHAAGLFREGIHRQNDQYWDAYFRIIKRWEEKQFLEMFP